MVQPEQENAGSPSVSVPAAESLEQVVAELDALSLQRSAVNRGPEGKLPDHQPRIRGGATEGDRSGTVAQPCSYAAMRCAGCGEEFYTGEPMISHLDGVVHDLESCRHSHSSNFEARLLQERADASGSSQMWHAVYSDEPGVSGVYVTKSEADSLLKGSAGRSARYLACKSEEDGHTFVRRCLHEHATRSLHAALPEQGGLAGSASKRVQTAEKLSASRLEKIERCIAGKCGMEHGVGLSTACRMGCGRWLHVEKCAEMGRGFAALGNFTCPQCVAKEMMVDGAVPTDRVLSVATRSSVLRLSQGKQTTGASYSAYTSLEDEYVLGLGEALGMVMRLPRHSPETFMAFLTWMATDKSRVRSIESVMRSAGAFMTKLKIPDVTKDKEVQAHAKDLLDKCGTEHEPATAATPRMVHHLVRQRGAVDCRYLQSSFLRSREKVQIVAEAVGGCRISEVTGGGEAHGVLANETCIITNPETGEEVVEMKLEHSKTGFARFLDLKGVTDGHEIPVAQLLRDYWWQAGMPTTTRKVMGMSVVRPDFWVVRISLLGLHDFAVFEGVMGRIRDPRVLPIKNALIAKARLKHSAGDEDKKFINIAAGRGTDASLVAMVELFTEKGMSARVVPGPLLLSTTGGSKGQIMPVPYATSSAFGPTKELLQKAWEMANADEEDPDKELEERRGRPPLWTTHSLRRAADTVARRDRKKNEVSEEEIDIYLGWHEKILLKEMQRHYEALDMHARMRQARITGGM